MVTHGGEVKGKLENGMGSQYSHTTSERGVSSINTADAHNSAASSRLNWRPCRFKWTRTFRRKTKSGFCTCAITFQTQSATILYRTTHQNREDTSFSPSVWGSLLQILAVIVKNRFYFYITNFLVASATARNFSDRLRYKSFYCVISHPTTNVSISNHL